MKNALKLEIQRLKTLRNQLINEEHMIKTLMSSVYGVFGNSSFICSNKDFAEAITLQATDINFNYIKRYINNYFRKNWKDDFELHKKLDIIVNDNVDEEVIIFGVTDSIFCDFGKVLKTCDYNGDAKFFIETIYNFRLKGLLEHLLNLYAEKYNTQNILNLELEDIYDKILIIGSKNYIAMSKNDFVFKGVEITKSSTPLFIREKLKAIIEYVFKNKINKDRLLSLLKEIKEEFKLENINNISYLIRISDYSKYVLNDRDKIEIVDQSPNFIKACAIYNFNLNQSKYKRKYSLIKAGDKIRYYYAKGSNDIYAFLPGQYPLELNPPEYDHELMFNKMLIQPLNKILKNGFGWEIPNNLMTKGLF